MGDLSGRTIKGYEFKDQVGKGGFGVVYRAYQPLLKREVALKAILPLFTNNPDFIRRFEFEAELIARLEHPHIVPLFDYWREPDGAYLVMRLLRGGSLRDVIGIETIAPGRAADLLDQITSALHVAHRSGVVHRDIKPANILLDDEGNAYLTDFGIAKSPDYKSDSGDGISGSVPYISPEQLQGGRISAQADIYALGVMLYEMLSGRHPFAGATLTEMVFKHIQEPLPDITLLMPGLPSEVDGVIQKATSKEASERFGDVREMAAALRSALAGEAMVSVVTTIIDDDTFADLLNPYKGLRAFQEGDEGEYYGRESLVERLLSRSGESGQDARFLAVVGPSGSGKSSVVKAGVIPAVRRGKLPGSQNWFIVEMFPGAHPFAELEAALLRIAVNPPESLINQLKEHDGLLRAVKRVMPDDGSELLLIIDQFEEVFTLVDDEGTRDLFLDSLVSAVRDPRSRVRVIITLRADFYDRPLQYLNFGELLRKRTEIVLPMSPAELEAAIARPAEGAGARLQNGLIEAILKDVGGQPGTLPLLQYALTELFERRRGRTLMLEAYQEIGGVAGALAKRAEDLYIELDGPAQEAARQLFLRLVTLGEGTEDTRRRVRRDELSDDSNIDAVIDLYGVGRLLTFDRDPVTRGPTLEVAHEALIRTWERLHGWVYHARDDLRLHRRLTLAAAEWLESGEDDGLLARDTRLEQFESWLEQTDLALNENERRYLQMSLEARVHREQAEAYRKAQEAEIARRAQNFQRASMILGFMVAAAILAVGVSVIAFWGARNEIQDVNTRVPATLDAVATEVRQQRDLASSLRLAAHADRVHHDIDPILGLSLALEANRIENPPGDAQTTLMNLALAPGPMRKLEGHNGQVLSVAFSPDGRSVLSAARDGEIILWDIASGHVVRKFTQRSEITWDLVFSQDGRTALSANRLTLWDVATGTVLRTFTDATSNAELSAAFSPDGRTALSGGERGGATLWNIATGELLWTQSSLTGSIYSVAFSPDGRTAIGGTYDETIDLWDVATGERLRTFTGHSGTVSSVAFSPDGQTILSGSYDTTLMLWDVATGERLRSFTGHTGIVNKVAFSPDSLHALSASEDNTIILWDVDTGYALHTFIGHSGSVTDAAFSPDGRTIASSSNDGTLILWDVARAVELHTFAGHSAPVLTVASSPDGRTALSGSRDNRLILWDLFSGQAIRIITGNTNAVTSVVFSPDGQIALSGSWDNKLILWEVDSGEQLRNFVGHTGTITGVDYSPDGQTILSGSYDKTLMLWDVSNGTALRTFTGHTDYVMAVRYSPDGQIALSASRDGTLILWDVLNGTTLRTFSGHTGYVTAVAFSPDGQTAISGSADRSLILWDIATGTALRTFRGHSGSVTGVVFSPDGQKILSSSSDNTLVLWDVGTGEPMRTFMGHTNVVTSVAFTPDGRSALSASVDGVVNHWRIDTLEQLVDWTLVNRAVRPLTCEERTVYGALALCVDGTPASTPTLRSTQTPFPSATIPVWTPVASPTAGT